MAQSSRTVHTCREQQDGGRDVGHTAGGRGNAGIKGVGREGAGHQPQATNQAAGVLSGRACLSKRTASTLPPYSASSLSTASSSAWRVACSKTCGLAVRQAAAHEEGRLCVLPSNSLYTCTRVAAAGVYTALVYALQAHITSVVGQVAPSSDDLTITNEHTAAGRPVQEGGKGVGDWGQCSHQQELIIRNSTGKQAEQRR